MSKRTPNDQRRLRPTIGLVIDYVSTTYGPQHAIWVGATDAARERDVNLICLAGGALHFPSDEFEYQRTILYDLIDKENMNGLIISATVGSHLNPEDFRNFYNRYHPLPMVGIAMPQASIPSILVDNERGIRDAIAHLIEVHGLSRIAFIRGPESSEEAEQRYRTYTNTLAEYGLPLNPELVAPGDFSSGTGAVTLFLDERNLRIGTDLEAVVAANDAMALTAMQALQSRGVYVPRDLAIIGFDNMEQTRAFTPPLTTVRQPLYEQGKTAVEMLLELLAGEEVPDQVTLPTELIVRQSCGCLGQALAQAAAQADPAATTTGTFEATLATQRERILSDMTPSTDTAGAQPQTVASWSAQLLDAFAVDLQSEETSDTFLHTLDQALRQTMAEGEDVAAWHGTLSALRRHMLPALTSDEVLLRAENLWQQARVMVGEAAWRVQMFQRLQIAGQTALLPFTYQALVTTFDLKELTGAVAQQLPQMGIERCYVSLYENPGEPTAWSWLVVGYDENGRIDPEAGKRRFPTRRLVPEGLLSHDKRHTLLVEPLYLRDEEFGLALFEVGPLEGEIYTTLGLQISSALKGILLLRERKEAEEALRRRTGELEAHNAELDAFAHTVAHDLKTPLSTMVLWSTMLEADLQEMPLEEMDEALHRITQAGQRMTNIINELLLLSSVRKAEDIKMEPLDMASIVAEAQNRLEDLIEERQVQVVTPDEWPTAMGHAPWVEEIWVNYISNAVKYGGHPGEGLPPHVTLGFDELADSYVRFWVRDNGPGLAPEEQARLFTPFTRLHQARVEGHGLGLSIVQRIVEKLGGETGVESEAGKGSTFYFTLPGASHTTR